MLVVLARNLSYGMLSEPVLPWHTRPEKHLGILTGFLVLLCILSVGLVSKPVRAFVFPSTGSRRNDLNGPPRSITPN